jgi:hypothetical protein
MFDEKTPMAKYEHLAGEAQQTESEAGMPPMKLIEKKSSPYVRMGFGQDLKMGIMMVVVFAIAAFSYYYTFFETQNLGKANSIVQVKQHPEAVYLGGFNNPMSTLDYIWNQKRFKADSITEEDE